MDATNRVVAGWILEERLGSGGFGEVWKARRRHVELFRALKLMPVSSETAFASWRHEISRLEELSHPNIVRFYDADIVADGGPYDDFAWIATELCERSLADELRRRPDHRLDAEECALLVDGMLAALAAAHGSGCVHRDVKPANILRHPAVGWKLCDFGTARLIPAGESHARTAVVGTFPYMSPAAHRGHQDQAADLYALGVTVQEALCGRRLHPRADGMTDSEYVKFILDTPPVIAADLDPWWRSLVAALIGGHGPIGAGELLDELRRTGRVPPAPAPAALPVPGPADALPPAPSPSPAAAPAAPSPAPTQADEPPAVTTRSPTRTRADATRRHPTGTVPARSGSRPPARPPTRRPTPAPRAEREHLVGILLLIVGSVTVAGLLLYQLVANPWAIVGFAAAIVILLVLLIALS
jgi:serine/threonine-protein kinase